MKTLFLVLFLTTMSTITKAAQKVQILKADVIGENRYVNLFLILNDVNDAEKLHITEYQNGAIFGETIFDGKSVNEGVLLLAIKSHKVLKLISPNFTTIAGGNVTLDFLYNGITGSRGSVDFDLVREGDDWQLYKNNVKIDNIRIKKNRKFGKDLGIKRIEYN